MSKNHSEPQSNIDDELDNYLKTKKVNPVVSTASEGIDLFSSGPEKKKSLLHRLLRFLQTFQIANLR